MKEPQVGLAISTFRQDAVVCALLDCVQEECADLFRTIIIVDSQGSGAIAAHIKERGYTNVILRDSDRNLGSAGNLSLRLKIAAEEGLDYVYAVNHDGTVDRDTVTKLVAFVATHDRVGAAYPMRFMRGRNRYDFTGIMRLPMPIHVGNGLEKSESPVDVYWASSNGALYGLEPVREGLLPWGDLWMGWEDLGYGWLLERKGWKQVLVPGTHFDDNYEFAARTLGRPVVIADKPAWYAYYGTRNLILVARRTESAPTDYLGVAARILVEVGLTTAFKKNKLTRLRYIAAGLRDGFADRAGKWRVG